MKRLLYDGIVIVFPGFSGQIHGAEPFIDGFADFCRSAKIEPFRVLDPQVDVIADTAIASFGFEMVY